jgi:undecaprenyl diphosphate synthase
MDGNGRWAKARGLPRKVGHEQGVEAVRRTVRAAGDLGIKHLTLYGFSAENWRRPEEEVNDLMGLLRLYIRKDLAELVSNGVRIRIIGNREHLAPDIIKLIDDAESRSAANDESFLTIAFNYGARQEIASAARDLARQAAAGTLDPEAIDETVFAGALQTAGQPDPDLVIRTSGEERLSNFLLWQSAYAEFYFDDVLWPDFDRAHLERAIEAFADRERRFGGRPDEDGGRRIDRAG